MKVLEKKQKWKKETAQKTIKEDKYYYSEYINMENTKYWGWGINKEDAENKALDHFYINRFC